mmetsp:Transcript_29377/g.53884  ORF Transcript_29377/g.53884 Transcript_29377/m.53884 type:complete len:132 (+) Transcript_29377:99-494(+)
MILRMRALRKCRLAISWTLFQKKSDMITNIVTSSSTILPSDPPVSINDFANRTSPFTGSAFRSIHQPRHPIIACSQSQCPKASKNFSSPSLHHPQQHQHHHRPAKSVPIRPPQSLDSKICQYAADLHRKRP